MGIVADTHAHIYDCYSRERALDAARRNLGRLAEAAGMERPQRALLLAERSDCSFFDHLESQNGAARLEDVWVFPGRQIATCERVEVLGLLCCDRISDGLPLAETIRAVHAARGIPVLCWAFGKWTGSRAKLVRAALEDRDIEPLFMGDSSLRAAPAALFPVERNVLAGSDPLPFAGEEENLGRYGVAIDADIDESDPLESMRRAILSAPLRVIGSRCSLLAASYRIIRNEIVRRTGACS